MFRDRVPSARQAPPIEIDGNPIPAVGWEHGDLIYAYTSEPGPTGRYHSARLRVRDGRKDGSSVNFATLDEAQEHAARLYWQYAFGTKPETFAALTEIATRFEYWRARKAALGGGELFGQVE